MRPNDVAQALDLDRIAKDHVWKVEPSCATSGEGKNWRSKQNQK
jgi:ADP-ribosylation factor protein 6